MGGNVIDFKRLSFNKIVLFLNIFFLHIFKNNFKKINKNINALQNIKFLLK